MAKKLQNSKKQEKKKKLMNELIEDVVLVAIVLAVVFVVKHFLIINAVIPSASMENTIRQETEFSVTDLPIPLVIQNGVRL